MRTFFWPCFTAEFKTQYSWPFGILGRSAKNWPARHPVNPPNVAYLAQTRCARMRVTRQQFGVQRTRSYKAFASRDDPQRTLAALKPNAPRYAGWCPKAFAAVAKDPAIPRTIGKAKNHKPSRAPRPKRAGPGKALFMLKINPSMLLPANCLSADLRRGAPTRKSRRPSRKRRTLKLLGLKPGIFMCCNDDKTRF